MSSVLFVTWDGGGNVPPALAIAEELSSRGHDVRFLGHPAQEATFRDRGLAFSPFRSARRFDASMGASPVTLVGVFGDRAMGREVVTDLRTHPADLVVVDCLLFGVMDELRRADHEYAVLEHCFDGFLRKAARTPLAIVLRLLRFRLLPLIDAGRPTIAATLEELDSGHGAGVVHTGPVVRGVAASPVEPTVLVSLSTVGFRGLQRTWQRVLDAVDGLPARVIATTGPSIDPASLRAPANVELHRFLPHEDVLPEVSLVVGHGGHGTTMVTLAHGIPLLVLPLDPKTDQPIVGRTLERAGAGLTLSRRSPVRKIRAAIDNLLADPSYRTTATKLGSDIRAGDGRARAADALEASITNGAPQR